MIPTMPMVTRAMPICSISLRANATLELVLPTSSMRRASSTRIVPIEMEPNPQVQTFLVAASCSVALILHLLCLLDIVYILFFLLLARAPFIITRY